MRTPGADTNNIGGFCIQHSITQQGLAWSRLSGSSAVPCQRVALTTVEENLSVFRHQRKHRLSPEERAVAEGRESVVVAVRSKQLLATSFHPELTEDSRW